MTISRQEAEAQYLKAIEKNICSPEKATIFYSKQVLDYQLNLLRDIFPKKTKHAIAIKTCNQADVLAHIIQRGFGLEAASFEEVLLAKKAGAANDQIVFDSPVKTVNEINKCHNELPGMLLNANSLEELNRYPKNFNGHIGLRVNPLVENAGGTFFNVSTANSKFGVPVTKRKAIIENCIQYTEIDCLHFHIGSSLTDLSPNLKAITTIVDLAVEINNLRTKKGIENKIITLDIGGGIEFDKKSMCEFVAAMHHIPNISDFNLVTEYGNFVHKHNSFVASNIEYVLSNNTSLPSLVYVHVGADLFVRKVYSNLNANYPCSILYKDKPEENAELHSYNIVGPLCFAGDILFKDLKFHKIQEGDSLFIFNTGSNTLSMWSGHCSRDLPDFVFY